MQLQMPELLEADDHGPGVSQEGADMSAQSSSAGVERAEEQQQPKSGALARVLAQLQPLQSRRQRLQHATQHPAGSGTNSLATTSVTMPLHSGGYHTTHIVHSSPGNKAGSPLHSPTRHCQSAAGSLASALPVSPRVRPTIPSLDMLRFKHQADCLSTSTTMSDSLPGAMAQARPGRRYLPPAQPLPQSPHQSAAERRPPCSAGKRYPMLSHKSPQKYTASQGQQEGCRQLQIGASSSNATDKTSRPHQPQPMSDITSWLHNSSSASWEQPSQKAGGCVVAAASMDPQAADVPESFMEFVQPTGNHIASSAQCPRLPGQALASMLLGEELGLHHMLPQAADMTEQPATKTNNPTGPLSSIHTELPLFKDLPQQLPPRALLTTWQDTQHDDMAILAGPTSVGGHGEAPGRAGALAGGLQGNDHLPQQAAQGWQGASPPHQSAVTSAAWPSSPAQPRQLDFSHEGGVSATAAVRHHKAHDNWQVSQHTEASVTSAIWSGPSRRSLVHSNKHLSDTGVLSKSGAAQQQQQQQGQVLSRTALPYWPAAVATQQLEDSPVQAWISSPAVLGSKAQAQPQLQQASTLHAVTLPSHSSAEVDNPAGCQHTDINSSFDGHYKQDSYYTAIAGDQPQSQAGHKWGLQQQQPAAAAAPQTAEAWHAPEGLWGQFEPESPGAEEFEGRAALLTYMLAKALQVRSRRTQRVVLSAWRAWAHTTNLDRQLMASVATLHKEKLLRGALLAWRKWSTTRHSTQSTSTSNAASRPRTASLCNTNSSRSSRRQSRSDSPLQADGAAHTLSSHPGCAQSCSQLLPSKTVGEGTSTGQQLCQNSCDGCSPQQHQQKECIPRLSAAAQGGCRRSSSGVTGKGKPAGAPPHQDSVCGIAAGPRPRQYSAISTSSGDTSTAAQACHDTVVLEPGSTQELVLQALAEPSDASLGYGTAVTPAVLHPDDMAQPLLAPDEEQAPISDGQQRLVTVQQQSASDAADQQIGIPVRSVGALLESHQHFNELHRMLRDMEALLVTASPRKAQAAAVSAASGQAGSHPRMQHDAGSSTLKAVTNDTQQPAVYNNTSMEHLVNSYFGQYKQLHQQQEQEQQQQVCSDVDREHAPPITGSTSTCGNSAFGAVQTHHVPTSTQVAELFNTGCVAHTNALDSLSCQPAPAYDLCGRKQSQAEEYHIWQQQQQQWRQQTVASQQGCQVQQGQLSIESSSTAELQQHLLYMQQRIDDLERQVQMPRQAADLQGPIAAAATTVAAATTTATRTPAGTALPVVNSRAASHGGQMQSRVQSHKARTHSLRSSVPTAAAVVSTKQPSSVILHKGAKMDGTTQLGHSQSLIKASSKLPWLWSVNDGDPPHANMGLTGAKSGKPVETALPSSCTGRDVSLDVEESEEQLMQQLQDLEQALHRHKSTAHS